VVSDLRGCWMVMMMAGAAPTRMRVGADRRRRAAPHSLDVGFGDELTGSEDGAWGS
jgi:hypothetical protein